MNIVVDRPSILLHPAFRDEMSSLPELVAHVQEMDWNGLQNSEQLSLRFDKLTGRIRVIPRSEVMFDTIYPLKCLYPGFSIPGLMALQHCRDKGYQIYSSDNNLLSVAGELGIGRYELSSKRMERELLKETIRIKVVIRQERR